MASRRKEKTMMSILLPIISIVHSTFDLITSTKHGTSFMVVRFIPKLQTVGSPLPPLPWSPCPIRGRCDAWSLSRDIMNRCHIKAEMSLQSKWKVQHNFARHKRTTNSLRVELYHNPRRMSIPFPKSSEKPISKKF